MADAPIDTAVALIDSEHVAGEWDAEDRSWSARDWTPGPAGTVGLALPGGVELEIDVASPVTFVGLRVEEIPGRAGDRLPVATWRTLRRLLGRERATALVDLRGHRSHAADLPPRSGDDLGRRRARRTAAPQPSDRPGTGRGSPAGVTSSLAVLALAAALAERTTSPVARALGRTDAALAAADLGGRGIGLGARARIEAAAAAELLVDLDRRGELHTGAVDPKALWDALQRLIRLVPDPMAGELRRVADHGAGRFGPDVALDAMSADRAFGADALAAPSMAPAAPAAARAPRALRTAPVSEQLLPVDRLALPAELAGDPVVARVTTPSEAEVRVLGRAGAAAGWWARGFDADGTLVAAAPLRADRHDAVARLLLPPERLAGVEVDITDHPGEPRASRRMRVVVDAVQHGRQAARAERLGRGPAATERWSACESAWVIAGTPQQAGLARRFGDEARQGADRGRVPPALLADPVIESLDGP